MMDLPADPCGWGSQNRDQKPEGVMGQKISPVFMKRNLKQIDACKVLGMSTTTIHFYATGRRQMRVGRFAELVDKLSLTQGEVAYLLEAYWGEE
mgnify:CR=1 FL=1